MKDELIQKLTGFARQRDIPVTEATLEGATFLPGLDIQNGVLLVDAARVEWPGDILHEAGHIALTPPSRRAALGGKLSVTPAEEMATLAWSYAAAVAIGIDPAIVFHEGGYKKGGQQLIEQYSSGRPPGAGVLMLQWWGMTRSYPGMDVWVRTTEDPV